MTPNFYYEGKLWLRGHAVISGLDEVGRGAFAGPIVCGCVVFNKNFKASKIPKEIKIDDSKKLTHLQRGKADKWIRKNALGWGLGVASPAEINRRGITKATASGFRRAVSACNSRLKTRVDYILIDAFYIPYIRGYRMPLIKMQIKQYRSKLVKRIVNNGNQMAIINGDQKSLTIAAASIVAKVYRDRLMVKLDKNQRFKRYGWRKNKGYGTEYHRKAINEYGMTKHHRKLFCRNIIS